MTSPRTTTDLLRRFLLAIIVLGLVGTEIELLLLGHYEELWQLAPHVLIGLVLVTIVVHSITNSRGSVRTLQGLMVLLIVAGGIGVVLHYRGNLEFQLEIDATQPWWQLFKKAMRAKDPPALAPGVMAQLGLLGLVYAFRHPASGSRQRSPSPEE